MVNDIMQIIKEADSHADIGMLKDIEAFFVGNKEIFSYKVTVDTEEKIIIDIKLNGFTASLAKNIFTGLVNFVGYGCLDLYIKDEIGKQVKYFYVTADAPELLVTKMEIIIS